MEEKQWLSLQKVVFESVAKKLKDRFPHKSLRLVCVESNDDLIMKDFEFLKENRKIKFDLSEKIFINKYSGNPKHPVRLAVYYRGAPAGYAFGCLSDDELFLEVSYMEKRNDAHEDLDHQFLGIILNTFTAYGIALVISDIKVKYLALIAPVHGARKHYEGCGFIFRDKYRNTNCEAMTMALPDDIKIKDFVFNSSEK